MKQKKGLYLPHQLHDFGQNLPKKSSSQHSWLGVSLTQGGRRSRHPDSSSEAENMMGTVRHLNVKMAYIYMLINK